MSRLQYLARSAIRLADPAAFTCPNCGSKRSRSVARKYGIFSLRRCDQCQLQFRTPVDAPDHNEAFYQDDYAEGMTTEMPDDAELAKLRASRFAGSDRDYANRIAIVRALGLGAGDSIFDFGCSWGYGSWQFGEAGYQVESFELSRPRRTFAQTKLGVKAHDSFPPAVAPASFDVFFSSHVLEHVPSPSAILEEAMAIVRPGGFIVTIVPNGSDAARKENPHAWMTTWGGVHPNLLDPVFLRHAYGDNPAVFFSSHGNEPLVSTQESMLRGLAETGTPATGDIEKYELISVMKRA